EHPKVKSQDDLARLIGKTKVWVSEMLRILTLPAHLQSAVRCTELSISYDSMSRIARLKDPKMQRELVDQLLAGASQKEIRQQIDMVKGRTTSSTGKTTPKPKRVFRTAHRATVIIQATSAQLTNQQAIDALRDALSQTTG